MRCSPRTRTARRSSGRRTTCATRSGWTGYPRNDVLHLEPADLAERTAAVRRAVGVPDGARVVLYAPTWRDDRTEMVDYVDLTTFASRLGRRSRAAGARALPHAALRPGSRRRPAHRRHQLPEHDRAAAARRRAASPTTPRRCSTSPGRASRSSSSRPTSRTTAPICAASTSICSPRRPVRWCARAPSFGMPSWPPRRAGPVTRRPPIAPPPGARGSRRSTTATPANASCSACSTPAGFRAG